MGKGNKQILDINKKFDINCNNSLSICKVVYKIDRERIALKGYWIFLLIYSVLGLILMYKPFGNGQEYFSTLVMFLLPLIADIFNTKIYHNWISKIRILQLVILSVIFIICMSALFGDYVTFINNIITLKKPFPLISFSTNSLWITLLVVVMSLITNIVGAKSLIDEYLENQSNNSSGRTISA